MKKTITRQKSIDRTILILISYVRQNKDKGIGGGNYIDFIRANMDLTDSQLEDLFMDRFSATRALVDIHMCGMCRRLKDKSCRVCTPQEYYLYSRCDYEYQYRKSFDKYMPRNDSFQLF